MVSGVAAQAPPCPRPLPARGSPRLRGSAKFRQSLLVNYSDGMNTLDCGWHAVAVWLACRTWLRARAIGTQVLLGAQRTSACGPTMMMSVAVGEG